MGLAGPPPAQHQLPLPGPSAAVADRCGCSLPPRRTAWRAGVPPATRRFRHGQCDRPPWRCPLTRANAARRTDRPAGCQGRELTVAGSAPGACIRLVLAVAGAQKNFRAGADWFPRRAGEALPSNAPAAKRRPVMTRKARPDQTPEAARQQGMARLAGISAGVGVLSVAGAAGVAVALPASAHHAAATAASGSAKPSASASAKSSPSASAAPSASSGSAAATSGGS